MKRSKIVRNVAAVLVLASLLSGCHTAEWPWPEIFHPVSPSAEIIVPAGRTEEIPEYSGEPYFVLNNNQPGFDLGDFTTESFEHYSELDDLGRCGVAYANVGPDLLPTEERESIREIRPSGWQSVRYAFVDGESLYNRCHLIAFRLTGENANPCNLMTGTRYLNVEGMLPFETIVGNYVEDTGNHVLYRVTPVFEGDNLIADGVQIEAISVEDKGKGICFNVYLYNVQPGVTIHYATGDSEIDKAFFEGGEVLEYVININSKRFHFTFCDGVSGMKPENRQEYIGTRGELLMQGYKPCGSCKP